MTLKEFLEKNPSAIQEAEKCKDVGEFKKLIEKAGITFETEEKLNKAFDLVKSKNTTELSEDALDAVSGGGKKVYIHEAGSFSYDPTGRTGSLTMATDKGKKIAH